MSIVWGPSKIKGGKRKSINSLDSGYKRKAILKDLNFNQTTNSITALIGANGSGKTTLAKTLIGLQKENKGDITLYETKTKRKERLN